MSFIPFRHVRCHDHSVTRSRGGPDVNSHTCRDPQRSTGGRAQAPPQAFPPPPGATPPIAFSRPHFHAMPNDAALLVIVGSPSIDRCATDPNAALLLVRRPSLPLRNRTLGYHEKASGRSCRTLYMPEGRPTRDTVRKSSTSLLLPTSFPSVSEARPPG